MPPLNEYLFRHGLVWLEKKKSTQAKYGGNISGRLKKYFKYMLSVKC